MRTFLISLAVFLAFILSIPFELLVLILRIFNEEYSRFLSFKFLQLLSNMVFAIAGTKIHIDGLENIDTDNYVVFANHRSLLDITLILKVSTKPISFIAKKELMKIPIFNLWMHLLGCLFLDRKSIRKGYQTIMTGISKLKSGENIAIFPQGTRNKGDEFLPFKKGSFKLAIMSEAKIVPMAIFGADEVFEANGKFKKADVYLKIFEAIELKGKSDKEKRELCERAEEMIYNQYLKYKEETL